MKPPPEQAAERGSPLAPPGALAAEARLWLRIGCLSFGGPAGQITLMQRLLVEERRWISPRRFLSGLDLCLLLPGPEAQQLATYIGWTRHGWRGGVVAGGLFVLPGALAMVALAAAYVLWGALPAVAAAFAGVQAAVVAIVAEALVRIGRRALDSPGAAALALAAFAALALFDLPYPLVVAGAALGGLALARRERAGEALAETRPQESRRASWRPALAAALAWLVPLALLVALLGPQALLSRLAFAFAELAVVSFGGAYALLGALAERAVADGWLTSAQMADGLGLAETTPGPLILVLQFVAFVAAHGAAAQAPFAAGLAASAVALWALFPPSFVWIFFAGPHLARLERSPRLRRAVRGVSAAVVGVILHLTLFFALHVLFAQQQRLAWGPLSLLVPQLGSVDLGAVAIATLAALLLFAARQPLPRVLLVSALLGLLRAAL